MHLYLGTSGYSYAPWKGKFYPAKMPAAQMLPYYAERFPAVEINNTFYRMPAEALLADWAAAVPAGFQFALKSPRVITHTLRLAQADGALQQLFKVAMTLGEKLGPVLFQLPPFQKLDLPLLTTFLQTADGVAPQARLAFEFRHQSWFVPSVYEALRTHRAALCIAEADELVTPTEATTSWGYLRLRREGYDEPSLAAWAKQIQAQSWQAAYVFFKHEDGAAAPRLAAQLKAILADDPNIVFG